MGIAGIGLMSFPSPGMYLHPIGYPGLPHLSERLGEYRKGRSSISGEAIASGLGSPSHGSSVTPRQPRTSFWGGKGGSGDGKNDDGLLG